MVTVLISGSDRGLGLEFVRQYAARDCSVIATCRRPHEADALRALAAEKSNIVIESLDVSDDTSIAALAAKYRGRPIDLLVHNAGALGVPQDQTLGTFSRKSFHEVMEVNAFAPLAVTQAFREHLLAGKDKKVVAVTSTLGSIATVGGMPRGPYFYRMSKAALNMGLQGLGADLKAQGVIAAVLSPGSSDTEMFKAFSAGFAPARTAANTPAQSVAGMIGVIDRLDATQASQGILSFDGSIFPW